MDTINLLTTEWKKLIYNDLFIWSYTENCLDFETFLLLDEKDIKEIVPIVGHRIKLIKFLQEYRKKHMLTVTKDHHHGITNETDSKLLSTDSTVIIDGFLDSAPEELHVSFNCEKLPSTICDDSTRCVSDEPPTKQKSLNQALPVSGFTNIFGNDYNLKKFLKSTRTGQAIIGIYEKNYCLKHEEQTRLVHLIADQLCECNNSVSHQQFAAITEEIVQMFPNEVRGAYFVPPGGARRASSGRLVDRFRNQRKLFTRAKRISVSTVELEIDIDVEEHLAWLKNSNSPWKTVEELWSKTFQTRYNSMSNSIHEYIQQYPALQLPLGYTLVSS